MKMHPDFSYETILWKEGYAVIGIDEVGRGAFAGPVGVGGVVFDPGMSDSKRRNLLELGINDSKKLTPKKRLELSFHIKELADNYSVEFVDVETINNIGIGKAAFEGMRKVAQKLSQNMQNPYLLIDAFEIPNIPVSQKGIVYGDSLSLSIAAASIIAKVERDRLMEELSYEYKNYEWENNKGYGTLKHRKAISQFGLSQLHRIEFCKNSTEI